MKLSRRAFTVGAVAAVAGATAIARAGTGLETVPAGPGAELCLKPASELRKLFALKKLSPVELLKAQIDRIEALNGLVNCITFRHFDEALKAAAESEARYMRGEPRPLEGLTVALKDEHNRTGWAVTMGSLIYKDAPPATENAAIVDMLEAAGAVMHIQTTVPEMYLEGTTWTRLWGVTRNPWKSALHARRLVRRVWSRARGGLHHARNGQRHGRLNPASRVFRWPLRLQAALRAGSDERDRL